MYVHGQQVRNKSAASWQQVVAVVMEFGKRHTTRTTDFCPRQLVTDLSFMLRTCRLLAADLLRTVDLLWTCHGEVANLLRTCYGETGIMEVGLYGMLENAHKST